MLCGSHSVHVALLKFDNIWIIINFLCVHVALHLWNHWGVVTLLQPQSWLQTDAITSHTRYNFDFCLEGYFLSETNKKNRPKRFPVVFCLTIITVHGAPEAQTGRGLENLQIFISPSYLKLSSQLLGSPRKKEAYNTLTISQWFGSCFLVLTLFHKLICKAFTWT